MSHFLQLVLIPIFIVIYLELIGRWISYSIFHIKMHIYFPTGFIFLQALFYLTSPLIYLNVSFNTILCIFLLIILISIILVIKDINKIDHSFEYIDILISICVCVILSYFSYTTTLGNLNGFDSTFYLNLVSQNVGKKEINKFNILFNNGTVGDLAYYFSETYYYYGAVLSFFICKVLTFLKINAYYSISFIWVFQILFNLALGSIVSECRYYLKNKISFVLCVILTVFTIGKLYYNSVFGFFGNSWIVIVLSYVGLFLYKYFENNNCNYKYLIYICLFGLCSLSTSGNFIMVFLLYSMLFFLYKEKHVLKEYSVILFLPLLNTLLMERYDVYICLLIVASLCIAIYLLGNRIQKLLQRKNMIIYLLLFSFILLFILSRFFSDGLFDFSGFLNSKSQKADMTLNYFSFLGESYLIILYKVFILVLLFVSFIFNRKNKLVKLASVLFIVFFNPFCCNFINHYISVYYRAYSIIINPVVISLLFDSILSLISLSSIRNIIGIALVCLFILFGNIFKPIIYNYEFEPDEDYNGLYRMNNDEIDIINELKNNVHYYNDENPYILTNNILTLSLIPQGKYIYCRAYQKSSEWSNAENKIYEIFYEPQYLGDNIVDKPDYEHMSSYIKDAGIDYLVINKDVEIYDDSRGIYTYLFLKVNELCECYPIYENDSYVLYRFTNV